MSEETEGSEASGNEAAAIALADASRAEADAFRRDQRHRLHEQLKQLHLGMFKKWLGVLLRLATLRIGIAAAITATLSPLWMVVTEDVVSGGSRASFNFPAGRRRTF